MDTDPERWSPDPSAPGPILCLYPEILAQIFSYLSIRDRGRAAQVSKSWRDSAHEKWIWRGVEAKLHLRSQSGGLYSSLARRGIRKVQVLSLKRTLRDLVGGLSGMESLRLAGCYNVTDSTLNSAFSSSSLPLTSLTLLDLSLCKQVSDVSLGRIAAAAPNLATLELGGCCGISDRGLLLIAWGLRGLIRLNLRSCYLITDTGIGFLAGVVTRAHLEEPRLFEFLSKLDLLEEGEFLSNAPPMPEKVHKSGVKKSRMEGVSQCAICHQDLLPANPTRRKSRRIILPAASLERISGRTVFGTRTLQALNLQDCQKLTDSSLPSIARLPDLCSLNLSFCVQISDSGLSSLSLLGSLRDLNLRSCENITDSGLGNLSCVGRGLRSLDVSFCDKVGNPGLAYIASGMTQLRTLSLSACDISDEGLVRVAGELSQLVTLNLGQCRKITDESLKVVAEKCLGIEYIDLYGCGGISRAGLNLILQIPSMKSLNLGLWHLR